MPSNIDSSKPVYGTPTTQSVRDNFDIAKTEISALQSKTTNAPFLPLAGGIMSGILTLNADPKQNLEAATKQYVDNLAFGGSGGGGFADAPTDGMFYARGGGQTAPAINNDWETDVIFTSLTIAKDKNNKYFTIGQDATYNSLGLSITDNSFIRYDRTVKDLGFLLNNIDILTLSQDATYNFMKLSVADNSVIRYNRATRQLDFMMQGGGPQLSLGTTQNKVIGATTFTSALTAGNLAWKTPTYIAHTYSPTFTTTSSKIQFNCYWTDQTNSKMYSDGYPGITQIDANGTWQFLLGPHNTADTIANTWPVVLNIGQNNEMSFTGTIRSVNGRIIAQNGTSGSNPSVGCWDVGAGFAAGMWVYNGALNFGLFDGNGNPTSTYASVNNGSLTLYGTTFQVGANQVTGFTGIQTTAQYRYMKFQDNWALVFDANTGDLYYSDWQGNFRQVFRAGNGDIESPGTMRAYNGFASSSFYGNRFEFGWSGDYSYVVCRVDGSQIGNLIRSGQGSPNIILNIYVDGSGNLIFVVPGNYAWVGPSGWSDRKFKSKIKPSSKDAIELINKIPVHSAIYSPPVGQERMLDFTLMADEIKEIIPAAHVDLEVPITIDGEDEIRNDQGIDYTPITCAMVRAIQQLSQRLEKLENA